MLQKKPCNKVPFTSFLKLTLRRRIIAIEYQELHYPKSKEHKDGNFIPSYNMQSEHQIFLC